MELRKTLCIPIFDREVAFDADFRAIAKIEQVFDTGPEFAAAILANPRNVKRSQVAELITLWLANRDLPFKLNEIREHVTLAPVDRLRVYVGCIQAVALYMTRNIGDEEFAQLTKGEDLPEEAPPKKKRSSAKKKRSSRRATGSR